MVLSTSRRVVAGRVARVLVHVAAIQHTACGTIRRRGTRQLAAAARRTCLSLPSPRPPSGHGLHAPSLVPPSLNEASASCGQYHTTTQARGPLCFTLLFILLFVLLPPVPFFRSREQPNTRLRESEWDPFSESAMF